MEIIKFEGDNIDLSSNSYIIKEGKNFCIVDPSVSIAVLQKTLGDFCIDKKQKNDDKLTLRYVIVTHCHYDHVGALDEYVSRGAKVILHKNCVSNLLDDQINGTRSLAGNGRAYCIPKDQVVISPEGEIDLGLGKKFFVHYTPGHTDCSICLYNEEHIFSGDLIFAGGGFGRYDLLTSNMRSLVDSLRWVQSLNKSIIAHPGHGEEFLLKDYRNY